eukprot:SAG22_NODE_460_length_10218_cov_5.663109_5_plen_526_part_00
MVAHRIGTPTVKNWLKACHVAARDRDDDAAAAGLRRLLGGPEGTAYRQDLYDDDFDWTCLRPIIQRCQAVRAAKRAAEYAKRTAEYAVKQAAKQGAKQAAEQAAIEKYFSAEQVAAREAKKAELVAEHAAKLVAARAAREAEKAEKAAAREAGKAEKPWNIEVSPAALERFVKARPDVALRSVVSPEGPAAAGPAAAAAATIWASPMGAAGDRGVLCAVDGNLASSLHRRLRPLVEGALLWSPDITDATFRSVCEGWQTHAGYGRVTPANPEAQGSSFEEAELERPASTTVTWTYDSDPVPGSCRLSARSSREAQLAFANPGTPREGHRGQARHSLLAVGQGSSRNGNLVPSPAHSSVVRELAAACGVQQTGTISSEAPPMTYRMLAFPVGPSTSLSKHRDYRSGCGAVAFPILVVVATYFAKLRADGKYSLLDKKIDGKKLYAKYTTGAGAGSVPAIVLQTRGASPSAPAAQYRTAVTLYPGHQSVYVMTGWANAWYIHGVSGSGITNVAPGIIRISVPNHLFF